MSVYIQAIGTAVPSNKIAQDVHYTILESANGLTREQKLRMRNIYTHSGIQFRHSVLEEFGKEDLSANELFRPDVTGYNMPTSGRMELYERHAGELTMQAVKNCFEQINGFNVSSITHLITFSCTGMFAPGLDIQLVEKLGLHRNVERTCINFMGCYAGINALKTAYHITRSQPDAVVLVAGVELCSLHYQKSVEQKQVIANALFADGAAAAIVSSKHITGSVGFELKRFYAEFNPSGDKEMVWRIGDAGFNLLLSPEVPGIIRGNIRSLIDKLLQKAGLTQNDIDYYALHPGGTKILEACEEALQLKKQQNTISYQVLRDYGNMSSVTIFFVLQEYVKMLSETDKGKNILACAFGPGLTMESMILEVC